MAVVLAVKCLINNLKIKIMDGKKSILVNNEAKILYDLFKEFNDFCLTKGINTDLSGMRLFKEINLKKINKNNKSWHNSQLLF